MSAYFNIINMLMFALFFVKMYFILSCLSDYKHKQQRLHLCVCMHVHIQNIMKMPTEKVKVESKMWNFEICMMQHKKIKVQNFQASCKQHAILYTIEKGNWGNTHSIARFVFPIYLLNNFRPPCKYCTLYRIRTTVVYIYIYIDRPMTLCYQVSDAVL